MSNRAKVAVPIQGDVDARGGGPEPHVPAVPESRVLRIGLVNNMPEAAFEETHDSFENLLLAGARGVGIELRCYRIPGLPRGPAICRTGPYAYRDVEDLYQDPPDALVVTGTEPVTADLTARALLGLVDGPAALGRGNRALNLAVVPRCTRRIAGTGPGRSCATVRQAQRCLPSSGEPVASSRSWTRRHCRIPAFTLERGAGKVRAVSRVRRRRRHSRRRMDSGLP